MDGEDRKNELSDSGQTTAGAGIQLYGSIIQGYLRKPLSEVS